MIRSRQPGFRFAAGALVLVFVVVILGAWTRLADAGLGCPDWPGCYGFAGIPMSEERIALAEMRFPDAPVEVDKAWPEMIHRYFAGALGLVILGLAVQAWRRRDEPDRPLLLPLALVAVVAVQAAFGAWTVTLKLWPQIVVAHLLGGFLTLSLLGLLWLRLGWKRPAVSGAMAGVFRRLRPLAVAGLVLLVVQIAIGGWVSANYAALACPDFPTCQGVWWPEADFAHGFNVLQEVGPNYLGGLMYSEGRIAIHLTHRIGAIFVALALGVLAWKLAMTPRAWHLRPLGLTLAGVLLLQILLGIANVVFSLPLLVATAHNAVGAGLLLTMVAVNHRVRATATQV